MPLHCSLYERQFLNFRNACNVIHLFRAAADFVIVLPYIYYRKMLIICFYCALDKVDSFFNIPICFGNATIALLVSVLFSTLIWNYDVLYSSLSRKWCSHQRKAD